MYKRQGTHGVISEKSFFEGLFSKSDNYENLVQQTSVVLEDQKFLIILRNRSETDRHGRSKLLRDHRKERNE